MSEVTVSQNYSFRRRWLRPYHQIGIIGIPGTGKTTLARWLYSIYRWGRSSNGLVKSVYFQYEKDKQEDFFQAVRELRATYAYVVIDDLSFAMQAMSRATREFLHNIMKIRHLNTSVKHWVVVFIAHYSRAVLPVLRQSATRILTAIPEPEEIEHLAYAFTRQLLWDYYYLYTSQPGAHWIAVNWLGQLGIARFRKPKQRCWDIVVSGPECV